MPVPPRNPHAGKTTNLPDYLRRKSGLVSVHLEVEANTKAAKGDPADFAMNFFTIQDRAGRELAQAARDAMSRLLMVGGEDNIGFTGAASENLFVRSVDRVQQRGGVVTEVVWFVYEGSKTRANKAIRKGVRPNPKRWEEAWDKAQSTRQSGTGAGSSQIQGGFLGSLSAWARAKGLRPRMTIMAKRPGKRSLAPRRKQTSPWNSMIWALWHSIKVKGMSESYRDRFGTPFYDYVARVTGGKFAKGKGGSSNSTFRQSIQSRMEKRGEVWENVQRVTADYVYTMFGKVGNQIVSGRVTGRALGVNQLVGQSSDIGFYRSK